MLHLALPAYALLFLSTGPHSGSTALLWIVPVWLTVVVDLFSPNRSSSSPRRLPARAYDALLYALAALQVATIVLLLQMAAQLQWSSLPATLTSLSNLLVIKIVIGTSSAFCGVVLAHEMIHRPQRHLQLLGRLLLSLVCYEHFATEHIRGNHRRVGGADDPATAHYGESYQAFWWRTVPAQFNSAWRLENQRLSTVSPLKWQAHLLQHRVAQGVLFQMILLSVISYEFGLTALLAFLIQAVAAVRKLEAVNYLEHWGLERNGRAISVTDSWDSDSWLSQNSLIGLAHHTDHHRNASRPWQQLQRSQASPKLPYGYFAMLFFAVVMNRQCQQLLSQELRSKKLGPFREAVRE